MSHERDQDPLKPTFRGTSHFWAFVLAIPAGLALILTAHGGTRELAASIYAASLAAMFGISALYHRLDWSPAAGVWMRRLDHAGIYLVIAGSYTPIGMLAMPGPAGSLLLKLVWFGALAGMIKCLLWINAPRAVGVALYVLLGSTALFFLPQTIAALGPTLFATVATGGLLYIVGAMIYATKRPDPLPTVFGYHEIFHALVIAASICHFVVITRVLAAA